jgi:hypothetical protein
VAVARKNVEALVAAAADSLAVVRDAAPQFYRCPGGHDLPHRTPWGRCSALDCCDDSATRKASRRVGALAQSGEPTVQPAQHEAYMMPRGLEALVFEREIESPLQAANVQARAEEANVMARATGRKAARDALAPPPEVPVPPSMADGAKGYVRQRLDDLAPLALHELEFMMRYGGAQQRLDAASEILDRAGHSRRPQAQPDMRGPVLIVNQLQVAPWDVQVKGGGVIDVTAEACNGLPKR